MKGGLTVVFCAMAPAARTTTRRDEIRILSDMEGYEGVIEGLFFRL